MLATFLLIMLYFISHSASKDYKTEAEAFLKRSGKLSDEEIAHIVPKTSKEVREMKLMEKEQAHLLQYEVEILRKVVWSEHGGAEAAARLEASGVLTQDEIAFMNGIAATKKAEAPREAGANSNKPDKTPPPPLPAAVSSPPKHASKPTTTALKPIDPTKPV